MDKVRIAKQLVRLAKSLVATDYPTYYGVKDLGSLDQKYFGWLKCLRCIGGRYKYDYKIDPECGSDGIDLYELADELNKLCKDTAKVVTRDLPNSGLVTWIHIVDPVCQMLESIGVLDHGI